MLRVAVAEHTDRIDVGGGVHVLRMVDPAGALGIEHTCKDIGDGDRLVCAPVLSDGHHVTTSGDGSLTVSPSILCSDCGLHGYVTDGVWRSC